MRNTQKKRQVKREQKYQGVDELNEEQVTNTKLKNKEKGRGDKETNGRKRVKDRRN